MSRWVYLLGLPQQIKANVQQTLLKVVLALVGILLLLMAAVFAVAALYSWLDTQLAAHLAALCVAGVLTLIGVIFFLIARLYRRGGGKSARNTRALPQSGRHNDPAALTLESALADEIRNRPFSLILTAVATGVIVGLLRRNPPP